MAVTDQDIARIRLNDLNLPECRQALAGFLAAALLEAGIGVQARLLDTAIGIYAEAVHTGVLEMAQLVQRHEDEETH